MATKNNKPSNGGVVQERRLKPAEALIYQIIFRQAGTLAKALLEGVMNSVDALEQAISQNIIPREHAGISVELDQQGFIIKDNGKGFVDHYEIDEFFETFGTEHTLDEHGISQDAKFGTFRIGRGQLFAFAKTAWRSGQFLMDVDVKNRGLDWSLTSELEPAPGCQINGELYQPLSAPDLRETIRALKEMVEWVSIPVTLNGELVSKDPAQHTLWDENTPDYYLQWNKIPSGSGVQIYQQGVFVMRSFSYTYGVDALLVTKRALKLNTARNDVLADCPLWTAVRRRLQKLGDTVIREKAARTEYLSPAERLAVMEKVRGGVMSLEECGTLPILEDIKGRVWTPMQIGRRCSKASDWLTLPDGKYGIAFAPLHSALGDKIIQQQTATVLNEDVIELLGCSDSQKAFWEICRMISSNFTSRARVCTLDEALAVTDLTYKTISPKLHNAREKLIIKAIVQAEWTLKEVFRRASDGYRWQPRAIGIGSSAVANAWTDGATYVTLNRDFIKAPEHGEAFFHKLASVLIHEYCHLSGSDCDHVHSPAFYQLFHDVSIAGCHRLGRMIYENYTRELRRNRGKLPQRVMNAIQAQADAAFNSSLLAQLDLDAAEQRAAGK